MVIKSTKNIGGPREDLEAIPEGNRLVGELSKSGWRPTGEFCRLARKLHDINAKLWRIEDAVRDSALESSEVAALKREIDELNLERHVVVARIDEMVDRAAGLQLDLDDRRAVVNSESIGQMVDRISIVVLKIQAHQPVRAGALGRRVELLTRSFDRVMAALRAGRGITQSFDEAKTYGRSSSTERSE